MGTISLAVALNASGEVVAVKLLKGIEPGLDNKTIEAVRQWKFTPATMGGQPVPVQFRVMVEFKLL